MIMQVALAAALAFCLLAAPFAAEGQQARRVWRVGGRMSSLNRVGETDR